MPLPQLSDEQRKAALEKAAAARHARAELRDKIKKGEVSLEEVLDSEDPIAARMKVSALIESLPGYGKAKAAKIMNELGISPSRALALASASSCLRLSPSSGTPGTSLCRFRTVRRRQGNSPQTCARGAS